MMTVVEIICGVDIKKRRYEEEEKKEKEAQATMGNQALLKRSVCALHPTISQSLPTASPPTTLTILGVRPMDAVSRCES